MTSAVLRGAAIGLALLGLLGAIAARAGWLVAAVPRLEGTGPWLLARASGVTAFVALTADVVLGLAVSTRLGDRVLGRGAGVELHRWLSPLALALVLGHALILLLDGYVGFDPIDVLVPFAARRAPVAIGLGVLAGYLALIVHLSFGLRKRLGPRTWRRLHHASFVAFGLAAAHGLAAGTDRAARWSALVYGLPLAAVIGLSAVRIARLLGSTDAGNSSRRQAASPRRD